MQFLLILFVFSFAHLQRMLEIKANKHLKPEYQNPSIHRFFRKGGVKWSKDKYIDKIGLKYRNLYYALPVVFFAIVLNLWRIQIFFFGETIQNQIYSQGNTADTSIIELKKMTDFEWDRVYIFDRGVTKKEAENILRFIPESSWQEQLFVFTKGGKYISSEELYFRMRERDIIVALDSDKTYMSLPADSAKFKLSQDFHNDVLSLKPVY